MEQELSYRKHVAHNSSRASPWPWNLR